MARTIPDSPPPAIFTNAVPRRQPKLLAQCGLVLALAQYRRLDYRRGKCISSWSFFIGVVPTALAAILRPLVGIGALGGRFRERHHAHSRPAADAFSSRGEIPAATPDDSQLMTPTVLP